MLPFGMKIHKGLYVAFEFSFGNSKFLGPKRSKTYPQPWASLGEGRGGQIPPTFQSGGDIISFVPPTFLS